MANKLNEILDMLMIMNDRFERMNDRFDTIEKQSNDANARLEKLIKRCQRV
jgi:chaperonin cofactor prefoldin